MRSPFDPDLELVKRCLAGQDSAWETLINAHTPKIYNRCYRFTGSREDAEDLTQEIFIKAFQSLRTYNPQVGSFQVWLNRVARNHLVDHYRRTKKDRLNTPLEDQLPKLEQINQPRDDAIGRIEQRERKEWLQRALNKLPPHLRDALILKDLQDLNYAEAAQILGVPEGTVKSRINRGRLELARVLKRME